MAYIDRTQTILALRWQQCADCRGRDNSDYADCDVCGIQQCIDAIKLMPEKDVEQVKRGKWERREEYNGYLGCSECHNAFIMREWVQNGKWNYCPSCGAKMDLSE